MLRSAASASQANVVSRPERGPEAVMSIVEAGPLLAIVRYRREGPLSDVVDALADAGARVVEVTLDTPGALAVVAHAAQAGHPIGVGTVLDARAVRASADAGATFVVSPGLIVDVVETALSVGVEPIPGVLSPTELLHAVQLGVRAVKVFPAGPVGGPAYIRALRGPFPELRLVPTGGISLGQVAGYLRAGATAVGLGAAIVGDDPPASDADMDALRNRVAQALGAAA
jgi:2-dehydro-3-deoxyphosphogluconate aldolase/(4S)-4-hydroxy-2-oxoglutarate aldolase